MWSFKQRDVRRLKESRDETDETHSRIQFITPEQKMTFYNSK
jgi:hypothetical protein